MTIAACTASLKFNPDNGYHRKYPTQSEVVSMVGWIDTKWNQIRHELIAMAAIVTAYKQEVNLIVISN